MANSLAVMFQREEIPEPLPKNKSTEMPAHRPNASKYIPGDKTAIKRGIKNQPWRSWKGRGKGKKKSTARAVMGA